VCIRGSGQWEGSINHWLETASTLKAIEPMFAEASDHRMLFGLCTGLHHRADDLQVAVKDVFQLETYFTN